MLTVCGCYVILMMAVSDIGIVTNDASKTPYHWCMVAEDTGWTALEARAPEGGVIECTASALPLHSVQGSKAATHENDKGASHSQWTGVKNEGVEGVRKSGLLRWGVGRGPLKGLKRPINEVERKNNNYWYKNNLNLKLKIKNNANYLIYIEWKHFWKWVCIKCLINFSMK
jgi:hypothetical protein